MELLYFGGSHSFMCGFHLELIMKMVYDVFFILHNMEFSDGLDLIKNCPAYFEYLVKTLS